MGLLPRVHRALALVLTLTAALPACGRRSDDSSLEQSDALPLREIRAIQHLMLYLRRSDALIVGIAEEPLSADEAATAFEGWLEDAGERVRTADDFIAYVASSHPETGDAIVLEFPDGTRERMGPWLSRELLVYRYPKPDYEDPIPDLPLPDAEIRAALEVVENSELDFVVHTGPNGSVETVYDGLRFSRMLKRKWDWLGHGMQDFDEWMAEIGSESFKSTIPYEVELDPGNRVPFEAWLELELDRRAREREAAKAAEQAELDAALEAQRPEPADGAPSEAQPEPAQSEANDDGHRAEAVDESE